MDVDAFTQRLKAGSYDICLADPPYSSRLADRLVRAWKETPYSRILAVETAAEQPLPTGGKRLILGDTAVTVYRTGETA